MTFKPFARFITTSAANMAGLALFGIAATGARAVTSHLWYGDLRSALFVGTIAALCFVSSLMFLMPGLAAADRVARTQLCPGPVRPRLRAKLPALLGLLLFNGLAVDVLPERGFPILANAVFGASWETRSYTVISSTAKSGPKGCRVKVVILLDPATGRTYDLCRVSKTIAERARPGNTLQALGKTSGYGLVIERVMVTQPHNASAAQP